MDINLPFWFVQGAAVCYAAGLLALVLRRPWPARVLQAAGILLHLVFLALRSWTFGFFAPMAALEEPFLLPLVVSLIAFALSCSRPPNRAATLLVLGLAAAFAAASLFFPRGLIPPNPISGSAYAPLFFLTEITAHALFYAAAAVAVVFIVRKGEFEPCHSLATWGFVSYTVAQVTGAIWCNLGWGAPFQWNNRHLQSAAIWVFYALYLHLRYVNGWTPARRAWAIASGGLLTMAFWLMGLLAEFAQPRIGGL